MKYYRLLGSTDLKEIGKYPQVNEAIYDTRWDSKNSLVLVHFKKAGSDVEIPQLILDKKAYATDLLAVILIPLKIIISDKLKTILESKNYAGIQFFKTILHKKNGVFLEYWITNPFEFKNEYIDFSASTIQCSSNGEVSYTQVQTLNEFDSLWEKGRNESIRKIYVINNLNLQPDRIKEDFFLLSRVNGGVGYYVSENLKHEIEQAGCTGVEFAKVNE